MTIFPVRSVVDSMSSVHHKHFLTSESLYKMRRLWPASKLRRMGKKHILVDSVGRLSSVLNDTVKLDRKDR